MTKNSSHLPLALIIICFLSSSVIADTKAPDFVEKTVKEQLSTLENAEQQWDWLQLNSGEWLKGDIKIMYNDVLEFDSDELGLMDFDMVDVYQIHTNRNYTVRIIGTHEHLVGVITLTPDYVIIKTDTQKVRYERWQLMTLVSGSEKPSNYWRIRLGLGVNMREGNSPQTEYNGNFNTRRQTVESRLSVDYLGTQTRTREIKTANNHRFSGNFDVFASEKGYFRPILFELFSDPFQNIDLKSTLGAGVGYYLIHNSKVEWDIFVGPGWQSTNFSQVEEDNSNHETSGVFVVATTLKTELSNTLDFNADHQVQWVNEESGGYTHHSVATFEYKVSGSVDFNVSFVWDFIESPTPGEDGIKPKNNDYRMLLSISYEYN